mgnify:CR=1 FL=1
MNRHEVEQRLRTVEAKVKFMMHTLALTRKDNDTGKTDSRTFGSLFEQAVANEVDTEHGEDVAGTPGNGRGDRDTLQRSGDAQAGDGGSDGTLTEAGPDGFPK